MSGASPAGSGPAGSGPAVSGAGVFDPGDSVASIQGPELAKQQSHVAQGIGRLIIQFREQPDIQSMLRAWLRETDELECAMFDLLAAFKLEDAVGDQLDILGAMVGEERQGRSDDVYRRFIQARIKSNNSSGLREELLQVLRLIEPTAEWALQELPPASFIAEEVTAGGSVADIDVVLEVVQRTKAAGVGAQVQFTLGALADGFTFSVGDGEEASSTQGFTDEPETTGGRLADVVA